MRMCGRAVFALPAANALLAGLAGCGAVPGAKPDAVLCSRGDTIAGPPTNCQDPAARSLPKAGTELPYEAHAAGRSPAAVTRPMRVVALERSDMPVEFVTHAVQGN
jgi:hypothetical protein